VNAEFQWWLLILGIVIGGALVYLVLADLHGDEPLDELRDEPLDETTPTDAGAASSDASAGPPSTGDVPDVERDRPETEPAEAHLDEAGAGHRPGQRGGVGEPLERGG
jgi:hypothetical protein